MLTGRRVKGRCVAPSKKNRRNRRLIALRGSITRTGVAGANSFTLKGKLGGHKLGTGTYRLTATPNANGGAGRSQSVTFQIVR